MENLRLPSLSRFAARLAHTKWRRIAVISAAAVATTLFVTVASQQFGAHETISGSEAIKMLVSAADGLRVRPSEGRLSGGFRYKPFTQAPRQDGHQDRKAKRRIIAIAELIEAALETTPTPSLHQALGTGYVLLGDYEMAIDAYQMALTSESGVRNVDDAVRRSTNGLLLNDLAVAWHARGRTADRRLVIEAAARARLLSKRPEAAWNYALAIGAIDLLDPCRWAWQAYREYADVADWRAESGRRLRQLAQRAERPPWKELETRLSVAFTSGDATDAQPWVRKYPQQTREWLEEEAFPEWASAWLSRDSSAVPKLARVTVISAQLAQVTGDPLLEHHAKALHRIARNSRHAVDGLALAHLAYKRGRDSYETDLANALVEAERSMTGFAAASVPFRHVSALTVANCLFISGKREQAAVFARTVTAAGRSQPYASTTARAHWLLGLIAMETGDPRDAIAEYEQAVKLFTATGETALRAAAISLRAQAQDSLGLVNESWKGRYEAFALHPYVQAKRWRHGILIEASMAAVRSRDFALARVLLDWTIAVDHETGDTLGLAAALRVRSMLHHLLEDERSAAADIASARHVSAGVRESITRNLFLSRLDTTAALQTLRRDPTRALKILTPQQSHQGTLVDVAETTLGLTAAFEQQPATAVRTLLAAIDALEKRFSADDLTLWHSPLVAQPVISLYDEGISLLVRNHRDADAFLLSERARVSVRRLNGYGATPAAFNAQLPDDMAAVVFYVSGADVVSWSVTTSGKADAVFHGGAASEMRRLAVDFTTALDTTRGDAAGRQLANMLLGPHWNRLASATRLLVVPDDALWNVPFAALRSPGGRYLSELFILETSGSVTEYSACTQQRYSRPRKALLVGAASASGSGLSPLPEVRREVARVRHTLEAARVTTQERSKIHGREAADADLIHFAGHTVTNMNDPALSYLALSSGARIYAREIRKWALGGRPVVMLSSCEGAKNPATHLDAWGSIADAFGHAGARGIVAAIVPVEDRKAAAFASAFYAQISHSDPAEALNRAQRSNVIRGAPVSEWAPYVYVIGSCPQNLRKAK